MNPNQALWEKGDFTRIAAFMRESGKALVERIGVEPGMRVLDLGCGDGTTAVPMASKGARVMGIDIARNLVEAGKRRAKEMGGEMGKDIGMEQLHFQVGDACKLEGVEDQAFDLTVSVFGAMFAPKPYDAAREMVRVTKRGGRIVMANWIPNDPTFIAQVLKISSAFAPPPAEGFISPVTWGVEGNVVERFGQAGVPAGRIVMERDEYHFVASEKSPEQFIEVFENYYGPTMNAVAAAEASGKKEELHEQLVELARAQNQSGGSGTRIAATFMRVTVSL